MSLLNNKINANLWAGAKKIKGLAGGISDFQNSTSGGQKIANIYGIIKSLQN